MITIIAAGVCERTLNTPLENTTHWNRSVFAIIAAGVCERTLLQRRRTLGQIGFQSTKSGA